MWPVPDARTNRRNDRGRDRRNRAKIDTDASQQLAAEYIVRGVPTPVLFADGQPVERLVDLQDEAPLRSVIETHA